MGAPYMMSTDINISFVPSELISFCEGFVPRSDLTIAQDHPLAPCSRCYYVKAAHIKYIREHRGTPAHLRPLLSPREEQVLRLLMKGSAIKQVARELHISYATAKTHVSKLYTKFGVNTRVGLINAARAAGFYGNN